jgi:hypothetical protein
MADKTSKMATPKPRPKNRKTAQAAADLAKVGRVVAKSLNLAPAAVVSMFEQNPRAIAAALKSLGKEKPKMARGGAALKKVPADNKGLKKLPTPVRNKMGYMKKGGMAKKKK